MSQDSRNKKRNRDSEAADGEDNGEAHSFSKRSFKPGKIMKKGRRDSKHGNSSR